MSEPTRVGDSQYAPYLQEEHIVTSYFLPQAPTPYHPTIMGATLAAVSYCNLQAALCSLLRSETITSRCGSGF
jgi:hypothetical protein